jgi:hypothetical protein
MSNEFTFSCRFFGVGLLGRTGARFIVRNGMQAYLTLSDAKNTEFQLRMRFWSYPYSYKT